MNEQTEYLSSAVEGIIHQALKASVKNPLESAFIAKFILSQSENAKKRRKAEEAGHHIPPFLIASITSQCNLHCKGCYARANNACGENFQTRGANHGTMETNLSGSVGAGDFLYPFSRRRTADADRCFTAGIPVSQYYFFRFLRMERYLTERRSGFSNSGGI